MFDLDMLLQQSNADGWAFMERVNGELKKVADDAKERRETTARMWRAIAATPAGRHVLTELAKEVVLKTAFPLPLAATVEQVAMHGVWTSAQQELAKTILAMAWNGAAVRSGPTPQPAAEQTDDGRPQPQPEPEPKPESRPARRRRKPAEPAAG